MPTLYSPAYGDDTLPVSWIAMKTVEGHLINITVDWLLKTEIERILRYGNK